jgi:hypothetical protein
MRSGFSGDLSLGLATFMFHFPVIRTCVVFIESPPPPEQWPYFDVIACVEVLSAFAFWGAEGQDSHFWTRRLGTAEPGNGGSDHC